MKSPYEIWTQKWGKTMLLCSCGTSIHDTQQARKGHEEARHSQALPAVYQPVPVTPAQFGEEDPAAECAFWDAHYAAAEADGGAA